MEERANPVYIIEYSMYLFLLQDIYAYPDEYNGQEYTDKVYVVELPHLYIDPGIDVTYLTRLNRFLYEFHIVYGYENIEYEVLSIGEYLGIMQQWIYENLPGLTVDDERLLAACRHIYESDLHGRIIAGWVTGMKAVIPYL